MSEVLTTQSTPLALDLTLPWTVDEEREKRFQRNLKRAIIGSIIFLLIMQFLPIFELTQENEQKIVKTTLIMEPKKVIEPEVVEPEKPKVKPKPKKQAVAKKINKKSAAPKQQEEDLVAAQGLDNLSNQLASLTTSLDMTKLKKKNTTSSDRGKVASARTERLSDDNLTRRSSGVEIDDESMRSDVSALASHQSAQVQGVSLNANVEGARESYGSLREGYRDMESIRRTLESTKSRVYTIYQRALTDHPELAGKFTFKLVIEPDGKVTRLQLVASELKLKQLEREILAHIERVNFGRADVLATSVEYKFVFLPS